MKAICDGIRSYLQEARDADDYHFRLTNVVMTGAVLIFTPVTCIIYWLITLFWSK